MIAIPKRIGHVILQVSNNFEVQYIFDTFRKRKQHLEGKVYHGCTHLTTENDNSNFENVNMYCYFSSLITKELH